MSEERKVLGYDPYTGQPIYDEQSQVNNGGQQMNNQYYYNNQQAYYGGQQVNAQESYRNQQMNQQAYYDNQQMNGQAGYPNGYNQQYYEGQGYGGTSNPPVKSPKGKKGLIIGLSVVGVLCVVAAVVVLVIFNRPEYKIMKAAENTLKDGGYFVNELTKTPKMGSEYTVNAEVKLEDDYNEATISSDVRFTNKVKQVKVNIDGDFDDTSVDVECLAELTEDEVRVAFPKYDDTILIYNYKERKRGAIQDLAGDELEQIDNALELLYSMGSSSGANKEMVSATKDLVKEFEYTKLSKEDFDVNGKTVSCSGYEITIPDRALKSYVKEYLKQIKDIYPDFFWDMLEDEAGYDFDELESIITMGIGMVGDISIEVYIYQGKIAGIVIPMPKQLAKDAYIEVDLEGGDYRMQNISVIVAEDGDKETILRVEGDRSGSTDSNEIYIEDEKVMSFEYDSKSGEFELGIPEEDFTFEGTFKVNGGAVEMTYTASEDDFNMDCNMKIKKGAKIDKIKGDEWDIGNENDIDEIADYLEDVLDF